jgi:uncharacterized protein (DUF2147 family)
MSRFFLLTLFFITGSFAAFAQKDVTGQWLTIDDESGQEQAVIDIYMRDGKLYGKVIKAFPGPGEDPDPICDNCEGADKDQKVLGMEIIRGLTWDEDQWEDGTILDAEKGTEYRCKIWREGERLMVRGYLGFFYRTQEWLPYQP